MDQLALPLGDVRNDAAASFPAPPPSSRSAGATPAAATTRVLRLGELIGSLSHALDLAAGQPLGHAVRSCWIGQQIGATLGLGATQMRELYYASLLKDAGDSSNAPYICRTFAACDLRFKQDRRIADQNPTGLPRFVIRHAGAAARWRTLLDALQNGAQIRRELTEMRCARRALLARQLNFGEEVAEAVHGLEEHWDGGGLPQGLAGREIPLYARIMLLAQTVDRLHASAGAQAACAQVARRSGRWFDPELATLFAALARDPRFWSRLAADDLEQHVFHLEPAQRQQTVDDDTLDDIAAVFGQVIDAKSAFTAGHSARVAQLADRIALQLGLDAAARRWLRRAALLHDLGMLGVSTRIIDKVGPLAASERAAVARHALDTERILAGISAFGVLARVAGAHHERLDGNGYPRGLDARHLRLETRILASADVFAALTAHRARRPALTFARALQTMQEMVGTALDADCVAALQRALDTPAAT